MLPPRYPRRAGGSSLREPVTPKPLHRSFSLYSQAPQSRASGPRRRGRDAKWALGPLATGTQASPGSSEAGPAPCTSAPGWGAEPSVTPHGPSGHLPLAGAPTSCDALRGQPRPHLSGRLLGPPPDRAGGPAGLVLPVGSGVAAARLAPVRLRPTHMGPSAASEALTTARRGPQRPSGRPALRTPPPLPLPVRPPTRGRPRPDLRGPPEGADRTAPGSICRASPVSCWRRTALQESQSLERRAGTAWHGSRGAHEARPWHVPGHATGGWHRRDAAIPLPCLLPRPDPPHAPAGPTATAATAVLSARAPLGGCPGLA